MAIQAVLRRSDRWARDLARRSHATWRWGLNAAPTLAFHRRGGAPDPATVALVAALDRDGIATTTLDALVGPESAAGLLSATTRVRQEAEGLVEAARARSEAGYGSVQKPYVVGLRDSGVPSPDPADPLTSFALDPRVVAVVHGYFEMFVRLRYVDLWHTLVTDAAPTQSQLWHRDPEDRLILKVFVALEDVDERSGPFHYAPGTHAKGPIRRRPAAATVDGSTPRSTDEQMADVVPRDRWRTATGPRGTVVFADTRGFHKGGHAIARERVLYVSQYLSRAAGRGGVPTDRPTHGR